MEVIPVDTVVSCLHAHVYLQHSFVIHVGLSVTLQGLISHGTAQEGLEGEWLQLQGADWNK